MFELNINSFFAELDEIMESNPLPGNCDGWEPDHTDHTETENETVDIIQ